MLNCQTPSLSCYEGQYNETFLFIVGSGIFGKEVGKETSISYETTPSMGLYKPPTSHSVNQDVFIKTVEKLDPYIMQ